MGSYVHGDKSILKNAGIQGINDVKALSPPPEIKNKVPARSYVGEVSYFICTRPGRGPVLLSGESSLFLTRLQGFPSKLQKRNSFCIFSRYMRFHVPS